VSCADFQAYRPECSDVPERRIVCLQRRFSPSDPWRGYVTGGGIGQPFHAHLVMLASWEVDAASARRTAV
jgi:hypothetical protein